MSAHKQQFNDYTIEGNIVKIVLERKNGDIFITQIDLEDLERIKQIPCRWGAAWFEDIQSYYARACEYVGLVDGKPKYRFRYLHREIMNAKPRKYVDHKNHDTLDNRKENLKVVEGAKNSSNRKGANKNSGTGHRNVNWGWDRAFYFVQFMRKGERFVWEFPLDKYDEACEFADKKRLELYGEFAGHS